MSRPEAVRSGTGTSRCGPATAATRQSQKAARRRPGRSSPRLAARAGAGGDGRRQVERLAAGAARRQQAHEEGQRQQQEGERQGEVNHGALRPRMRASSAAGSGGVRR